MGIYDRYHLSDSFTKDLLYDIGAVIKDQKDTYKKLKQSETLLLEVMDKVDSHVELVDLRDKIGNFLK